MTSLMAVFLLVCGIGGGIAEAQQPGTAGGDPASRFRHPRHHAASTRQPAVASTAHPSRPNETPVERAADKRLLQQQQSQSAHAADVNNQVVQQANAQRQKVQNEVRIQDAPGPAQTGVVPAAGVPLAPTTTDDRIQDAPGPAQTLPRLPATSPTVLPPQGGAAIGSPQPAAATTPETTPVPAESQPPLR